MYVWDCYRLMYFKTENSSGGVLFSAAWQQHTIQFIMLRKTLIILHDVSQDVLLWIHKLFSKNKHKNTKDVHNPLDKAELP